MAHGLTILYQIGDSLSVVVASHAFRNISPFYVRVLCANIVVSWLSKNVLCRRRVRETIL